MLDAMLQLTVYGFLVRMIVELIQGVFNLPGATKKHLVQGIAVAVSAVFVYLVGVNPVVLLGLGKMGAVLAGAAAKPVGVALLAAAAMGTNDLADLLLKLGGKK